MTQSRARKAAIRARMAQTGQSYSHARRAVEGEAREPVLPETALSALRAGLPVVLFGTGGRSEASVALSQEAAAAGREAVHWEPSASPESFYDPGSEGGWLRRSCATAAGGLARPANGVLVDTGVIAVAGQVNAMSPAPGLSAVADIASMLAPGALLSRIGLLGPDGQRLRERAEHALSGQGRSPEGVANSNRYLLAVARSPLAASLGPARPRLSYDSVADGALVASLAFGVPESLPDQPSGDDRIRDVLMGMAHLDLRELIAERKDATFHVLFDGPWARQVATRQAKPSYAVLNKQLVTDTKGTERLTVHVADGAGGWGTHQFPFSGLDWPVPDPRQERRPVVTFTSGRQPVA